VAEAAGNDCCAAVEVLDTAPSRLDCGCKAVVVGLYTGAAAVDSTASFPRPGCAGWSGMMMLSIYCGYLGSLAEVLHTFFKLALVLIVNNERSFFVKPT
jgi:hypothetical protein